MPWTIHTVLRYDPSRRAGTNPRGCHLLRHSLSWSNAGAAVCRGGRGSMRSLPVVAQAVDSGGTSFSMVSAVVHARDSAWLIGTSARHLFTI